MVVVVSLFFKEFVVSGLPYPVPLVGDGVGQLVGVVLFNYAFSITVPAWLNEKKSHVSVNMTIWGSSASITVMYVLFGILGAMAYASPPADMLPLASNRMTVSFGGAIALVYHGRIRGSSAKQAIVSSASARVCYRIRLLRSRTVATRILPPVSAREVSPQSGGFVPEVGIGSIGGSREHCWVRRVVSPVR